MRTVKNGSSTTAEMEVHRSRFIATVSRADSAAEARAAINQARRAYPDARHHCSAYIVHQEGMNPDTHSSDDGEPAGTAGMPMLEVLRHANLENLVAVVTRYFGGTLLGTGGLVRAYSHAVQKALAAAPLVQINRLIKFQATIPLRSAGRVEGEMRNTGWNVIAARWSDALVLEIAGIPGDKEQLDSQLATITRSNLAFHEVGTLSVEVDSAAQRS